MAGNGTGPRAMIEAWREQGADRLDPWRFQFIAALERRAASHHGEARRLLDGRLRILLRAYADDLEKAKFVATDAGSASAASTPACGAIAGLVERLASRSVAGNAGHAAGGTLPAVDPPPLAALDEFRQIWSRVRAESQLRQSLRQAPANAGPLNSDLLAHRAIALMRELSPGYLRHFLAHVDALSWLEQIGDGSAAAAREVPRAANPGRKRSRSKPTAERHNG